MSWKGAGSQNACAWLAVLLPLLPLLLLLRCAVLQT